MAWISAWVGCSGRAGRNLAAVRTRRSLASMSAVDGRVFVRYHGARAWCSAASSGWCPVVAYQQMARVWQASPNGTVRSTAWALRAVGLADPDQLLGIADGDLDRPAGGVALDGLPGAGLQVGADQRQVIAGPLSVLAQQDHADLLGAEHAVPQAAEDREVHR